MSVRGPPQAENTTNINRGWLGDNICDDMLNTKACCFDLFDCHCNGCDVLAYYKDTSHSISMSETTVYLGDHNCDSVLNTAKCCYDMGDCLTPCLTCKVAYKHSALGDFVCDMYLFHEDCCFDLGDCTNIHTRCPNCHFPFSIGLDFAEGLTFML